MNAECGDIDNYSNRHKISINRVLSYCIVRWRHRKCFRGQAFPKSIKRREISMQCLLMLLRITSNIPRDVGHDTTCSKSTIINHHVFILSQNDKSMNRILWVVVIIKCNFQTHFNELYRAYSFMVTIIEPYFKQEYDVCLLFVSNYFLSINHSWWRHPMETFPRYWPFVRGIHRSPVNSPHKGQWRGALMFSLICAWANGRANNRDAGDLRRNRAHYDVTVMVHQP